MPASPDLNALVAQRDQLKSQLSQIGEMRASELKNRSGKQPDGGAKTREVKLCTVWSAESRDAENRPVRDIGSVTYTAAVETAATLDTDAVPSAFTQRVLREATRRRFTKAAQTVVLGDGAAWIWRIAHELFPRAIQIVDRFHVKEHLSDVGKALYGPTSKAQLWAQRRHEKLDSGRLLTKSPAGSATSRRQLPRSQEVLALHPPQSESHAISAVPQAWPLHFYRRRGSWL